ncbi:MAG: hypothetical protein JWQ68_1194 [Cryobacterium sp.]|jgi:hypothetical protein|nr:hypothetical protein [Cryobacterium sp.]
MPTSHLNLTALSAREWTVRDEHNQNEDAGRLIALIECIGGRYEVMTFGDPLSFSSFTSLDRAFESLRSPAPAPIEVSGTGRPIAVLHGGIANTGKHLHRVG